MNPKKVLIWIFSIVGGILLLIFFLKVFNTPSKEEPSNSNNSNSGVYHEVLFLRDSSRIGPKKEWITPIVSYRYKLRSDGHSFYVQYAKCNGGWTKKFLVPKEGDEDIPTPSDAILGSLKITAGPNETQDYLIQLYEKIKIKIERN